MVGKKFNKIPLKELKGIITLQNKILDHFCLVTGIEKNYDLTIKILDITEEYQSDMDGDDNNVRICITHNIGSFDSKKKENQLNIFELHEVLASNFTLMPKIKQTIWSFKDFPYLKTVFIFDYYNFTKN